MLLERRSFYLDLPQHVLNEPSTGICYEHLQRHTVVGAIIGRTQPKKGLVARTEDTFSLGDNAGYIGDNLHVPGDHLLIKDFDGRAWQSTMLGCDGIVVQRNIEVSRCVL